jgi:hypothetical protein
MRGSSHAMCIPPRVAHARGPQISSVAQVSGLPASRGSGSSGSQAHACAGRSLEAPSHTWGRRSAARAPPRMHMRRTRRSISRLGSCWKANMLTDNGWKQMWM